MAASILVIADHRDVATFIARCLEGIGLRPLVATDVRHAGVLLSREQPDAVVLDLAAPGHASSVVQWLHRDPTRAAMAVVQVTIAARNGGVPRGERADMLVPKPFTPRQIVEAVRTALVRRAARRRTAYMKIPPFGASA